MSHVIQTNKLDDLCEKVIHRDDERIVFTHKGQKFALLTNEEFEFLQALEDRYDNEQADAAIKEMEEKGEKPIPYEQIRKELGLE